jgi:hypothetical protein
MWCAPRRGGRSPTGAAKIVSYSTARWLIGQEVFGAEDAFEVEQAAEKIGLAAFTRSDDKPPAPIYADILRGGSSSSGNGQT